MKIKIILVCFLLFLFPAMVYAVVDTDNDGIIDSEDNCIYVHNPDQVDTNQDGYGNMCDPDLDNDGNVTEKDEDIFNQIYGLTSENPDWNPEADLNSNNEIDISDVVIWMDMVGEAPGPSYGLNADKDGWIDEKDNCPGIYNPDQADTDGDGIGDECEGSTTTTSTTTSTTTPITTTTTVEAVTTNPVFVPTGSAYFTELPEKVELFIGDSITVSGKFVSTLNYNLYDTQFSLEAEGLNPNYYVISPQVELLIEKDDEVDVSVEFDIPEDAEIYTYQITIKASGASKTGLQTFSKTFKLLLKEKLEPLTTTTTTTTTTIPEEEGVKSVLNGLYSLVQASPAIVPVVILIILIIIVSYKITKPKSKGRYVSGKGWVRCTKTFKSLSNSSIKNLLTKW